MCRWMESHFHDWIDYNGVAFSIELLERGRTFSDFLGFLGDPTRVKNLPEARHLLTKIKPAMCCLLYLNRHILSRVFLKKKTILIRQIPHSRHQQDDKCPTNDRGVWARLELTEP